MTDSMRPLFPLRNTESAGVAKAGQPRTTQNFFSFADSCVHVADHEPEGGSATHTLFFLHGRLEDSRSWAPLIQRLRAPGSSARCIAIDFPGFGRSFSARRRGLSFQELSLLVKQVIQKFANRRAILVAHDSGGAIAQVCATDPELDLRAVILVNSATLQNPPEAISWLEGLLFGRRMAKLIGSSEGFHYLRDHWRNPRARAESIRAINALARTWPRYDESQRLGKRLHKLRTPTLVLWGGSDPIHPIRRGLELMALMPNASFFADERSGHWPELENTAWISGRIREFLFRLGAEEGKQIA